MGRLTHDRFGAGGVAIGFFAFTVTAVTACGSSSDGASGSNVDGGSTSDGGGSSSGSASSSGGSSSGAATTPCLSYASGLCNWLFRCIPNEVRGAFADVTTCKESVVIDCERTDKTVGAAPMNFACGAELETYSCAASVDFKVPPVVRTPACDIRGTQPLDRDCERDRQCLDGACVGSFVTSQGAIACGRCEALVQENGSCGDAPCAAGLFCIDGTCKKPPKKDEACGYRQCERPLRCVANKCADPLATGASCTIGVALDDPCDAQNGLVCTNGTCQPGVLQTSTTKGAGQPCSSAGVPECIWPTACIEGTCAIPEPKCD